MGISWKLVPRYLGWMLVSSILTFVILGFGKLPILLYTPPFVFPSLPLHYRNNIYIAKNSDRPLEPRVRGYFSKGTVILGSKRDS